MDIPLPHLYYSEKTKKFQAKRGFFAKSSVLFFVESAVEKKWTTSPFQPGKNFLSPQKGNKIPRKRSYPPKIPQCGKRRAKFSTRGGKPPLPEKEGVLGANRAKRGRISAFPCRERFLRRPKKLWKKGMCFPQTVEIGGKICYTFFMDRFALQAERYLSLITGEKGKKFDAFRALLLEYNQKYNLTSVVEEEEMRYKHFLDSAMGEQFFPRGAFVVEVGSGAGFPSIPLKLLREDLHFTLLESVGKKCDFLRQAIGELSLSQMQVLKLRAEEGGRGQLREQADVCCARAVARLNTLAEYCLPLVKVGGRFIAYKGELEEELQEARHAISLLGGEIEEEAHFSLPAGYGKRTILVVRKRAKTPEKYPRGRGKERSDPLL